VVYSNSKIAHLVSSSTVQSHMSYFWDNLASKHGRVVPPLWRGNRDRKSDGHRHEGIARDGSHLFPAFRIARAKASRDHRPMPVSGSGVMLVE
jgi:hypothetical protein